VAYVVNRGGPEAYRFEHVEGNPTLVPQRAAFAGGQPLFSAPAVLSRQGKVAFGGRHRVLLADLDKDGRFLPAGAEMTVNNPEVEALAYSARFDRLYVAVEGL
jgi:hypothetical protein